MEAKKMFYVQSALEMVLDRLEEDERLFSPLPLYCIEKGDESTVREVIRDCVGQSCAYLCVEYLVCIYFVDVNAVPLRVTSRDRVLRGVDIPHWIMTSLPLKYGAFAVSIKPQFTSCDNKDNKLQVFMMR